MESPASLGAVVRDRRLALGYSLGQLATKVNKTAASIRSWEKGDALPTESEAVALAGALDLDGGMLAELLADSEVWEAEPVAEVAVVDPWRGGKKPSSETPGAAAAVDEADESESDEAVPDEAETDEAETDEAEPEVGTSDEAALDEPGVETAAPGDGESGAIEDVDADEEPLAVAPVAVVDHVEDAGVEAEGSGSAESETDGDEPLSEVDAGPDEPVDDGVADAGVIDDVVDGHEALDVAKASLANEAIDRPAPLDSTIHEAMTEAVPVVPASVAVASPEAEAPAPRSAADPFPEARNSNPLIYWWDTTVGWYRAVFDPRRKWIYRVRFVLLLIAFYIMLRALAWAGSELWDALGEVLDSISFSPTETPDVTN